MNVVRFFLCLQIAMALFTLGGSVHAGDNPGITSDSRAEFIRNFARTGLNTTPEDAMLLRILVDSGKAKRGIEVGSATGYGAINMGMAFERNSGHLFTLEIDPKMADECRANIQTMGLDKSVTCVEGDALETLPGLEGAFDFLFIDAVKKDYLKYFKLVESKLTPGAVIVADNVIQSAEVMKDYLEYVQNNPAYETVIVRASDEKKDGMAITYKLK